MLIGWRAHSCPNYMSPCCFVLPLPRKLCGSRCSSLSSKSLGHKWILMTFWADVSVPGSSWLHFGSFLNSRRTLVLRARRSESFSSLQLCHSLSFPAHDRLTATCRYFLLNSQRNNTNSSSFVATFMAFLRVSVVLTWISICSWLLALASVVVYTLLVHFSSVHFYYRVFIF